MTPRQRFLACLLRQPADRPAIGNPVSIATQDLMQATGAFFPNAHLEPEPMAALAAAGHDILGFDTIAPVYSVTQESAALGCEVNWGHPAQMPTVRGRLLAPLSPRERAGVRVGVRASAPDIHIPPNFLTHPACAVVLDALRSLRRRYPNVALIGKTFGPWTLAYHLFGIEPFLMLTLDDPPQVREILHRLKDVAVLFAAAQFEAGADAVTLGDHATGDLVSAKMYRDLLQPIHAELAQRIPGPVILHICGDTADRLADIAKTGFACFHFDSKVPAHRAREIIEGGGEAGRSVGARQVAPGLSPLWERSPDREPSPSCRAGVHPPPASAVPSSPSRLPVGARLVAPSWERSPDREPSPPPVAVPPSPSWERAPAREPLPSPLPCSPLPSAARAGEGEAAEQSSAAGVRPPSLAGNINNPQTLLRGTPDDVAREVAECLRCGIEIIAPECAVPLTTPTENLQAITTAASASA